MFDNIKFWVKDLTRDEIMEVMRNMAILSAGSANFLQRGGWGITSAVTIESGQLYEYSDIDKFDFDMIMAKEGNTNYLLQLTIGQRVDYSFLLGESKDFDFSRLSPGYATKTAPKGCQHKFRAIQGIYGVLGYDCSLCHIKKEDA